MGSMINSVFQKVLGPEIGGIVGGIAGAVVDFYSGNFVGMAGNLTQVAGTISGSDELMMAARGIQMIGGFMGGDVSNVANLGSNAGSFASNASTFASYADDIAQLADMGTEFGQYAGYAVDAYKAVREVEEFYNNQQAYEQQRNIPTMHGSQVGW